MSRSEILNQISILENSIRNMEAKIRIIQERIDEAPRQSTSVSERWVNELRNLRYNLQDEKRKLSEYRNML